jgi:FtsH-binding integral membrane protein
MLGIPRRFSHFVFGIVQSGLTCAVAAAIAVLNEGIFLRRWVEAWLIAWLIMLPVVIFAAPGIRRLANALTRE